LVVKANAVVGAEVAPPPPELFLMRFTLLIYSGSRKKIHTAGSLVACWCGVPAFHLK
jgi:hypothetical protein